MTYEADLIVVGAGSAGAALAARRSEDPARRVLLVEAGPPDRRREIKVPAAFSTLFRTELDWASETLPEPGLDGRRLFWPHGRVLGGSSALNAMIWTRGHPGDYDRWAAQGATGWGWRDLAPWFDRIPIRRSQPVTVNPLTAAFLAAARSQGLGAAPAADSAHPGAAGLFDTTIHRGERQSTAGAYLAPARHRANLRILTGHTAEQIVFEGRRAVGVRLRGPDGAVQARAGTGVAVSAGAVGSPTLLLRSGVGPADQLRAAGVEVRHDLPGVGRNLQDHLAAGTLWEARRGFTLERAQGLRHRLAWLLFRRGPLVSNVAEAGAFLQVGPGAPVPDVEIIFAPVYFRDHGFHPPPGPAFTVAAVLLQPESRGRITLDPADPAAPPRIEANYLADPRDLDLLVEGARWTRRLAMDEAFAPFRGKELVPGAELQSAEALAAAIRAEAQTLYHPVGTCRMGSDDAAVVGPGLRVRGLEGLWVADASVMPTIPSAHTNAPTVAIAERAADLIG